jgi:predicted alpha/beta-hydrolase family hydrolase
LQRGDRNGLSIDIGLIPTSAGELGVTLDTQSGATALFVCAHGAGGNMDDRGMLAVSRAMAAGGLSVLRFNFPYRQRKSGRPDPMPTLTACIADVVAAARAELAPPRVIIGGRSMGGRAASMLAAEGFECDGLLLLAYPLHPPGQPAKLRDAHLPAIRMPVLCFNGTRDEFCTPELMNRAVAPLKERWTMHWLDGADHSFRVLRRSGRTDDDVMAEVTAATRDWLGSLGSR